MRVTRGEVYDVAVDLRNGSPTYGQWAGVLLTEANKELEGDDRGLPRGVPPSPRRTPTRCSPSTTATRWCSVWLRCARTAGLLRSARSTTSWTAPRTPWDPSHHVGPIFWTFPGFSIAGGWRQRMTVALCLPTTKVDESITEHRIVVRHAINDEVQHELEVMRDWFYDVVYNEDYLTQYGVQKGAAATGVGNTVFGRNEIGVQYLHRTINRLIDENHERVAEAT